MKPRRKSWMLITKRWAPFVIGGLALQFNLGGCDPTVRDTVLTGLQTTLTTLLTTVVQAFFLSLQDAGTTSQPVVQVIHSVAQSFFA